jgi:hypothetical protein
MSFERRVADACRWIVHVLELVVDTALRAASTLRFLISTGEQWAQQKKEHGVT